MAKRAIIAGVAALQQHYGVRPQRMLAAIGPCIGPCCYEVGDSTRQTFRDAGHHAALIDRWFTPQPSGRLYLDLWRAARDQLEGAGLLPHNIHAADLCTKTHASVLHSFRAAGEAVGRMAAVIRPRAPLHPSRG
jgi:copper oxidase (laccase) domain-containing protein